MQRVWIQLPGGEQEGEEQGPLLQGTPASPACRARRQVIRRLFLALLQVADGGGSASQDAKPPHLRLGPAKVSAVPQFP